MKPVFLIGYMGCGKTTLGEVLARQMGMRYIDLDELIETRQGMSTVRIFEELGEPRFRELEIQALQDSAAMTDVIIGTGGGTPCHGENMALMNRAGITVWLTTSPERITARLLLPPHTVLRSGSDAIRLHRHRDCRSHRTHRPSPGGAVAGVVAAGRHASSKSPDLPFSEI